MNDNNEHDPNEPVRYDEYGRPLYPRMIPGGVQPKDRPRVTLTKRSDYPRGSKEDIAGNRGR